MARNSTKRTPAKTECSLFVLLTAATLTVLGCAEDGTRFARMPAEETGVTFANTISETDRPTVLDYVYLYNGGGVGAGDLNGDGRTDLYFTGNRVSSALYLNRGEWRFEEVTAETGVGTNRWVNGVTIVDINQDGHEDIYLSVGGPRGTSAEEMENLLFVNDGDGTFTEAAGEYGLDDPEFTVQAAFFDYDGDGDLDAYLLQNATVTYNRSVPRPRKTEGEAAHTDRLYRNEGDGTFTNVSGEAGITIEGFGLGLLVHDFNGDGWPDIYAANDFLTGDLLYVNQRNGTFEERSSAYIDQQSYAAMGTDAADFSNDGLVDLFVAEMRPASYERRQVTTPTRSYAGIQRILERSYAAQYTRNTLQLNNGNRTFSEIGRMAGVEATDWSWSALFADLDNDTRKDLLVTNGIRRDVTDMDVEVSYGQSTASMQSEEEAAASRRLMQLRLQKLPEVKIPNYVFRNEGDLRFTDRTEAWGLDQPSYSNGAAYADLDGDGDLDLAVNNVDQEAFLYRNRTAEQAADHGGGTTDGGGGVANYLRIELAGTPPNRSAIGAEVRLQYDESTQYRYNQPVRGYQSTVADMLHFGLDTLTTVDTVRIRWPNGRIRTLTDVAAGQTLRIEKSGAGSRSSASSATDSTSLQPVAETRSPAGLFEPTSGLGLDFTHRENDYVDFEEHPLRLHMLSRLGPGLAVGDADGDGRDDLYVGGGAGQSGTLRIQQEDGTFRPIDGPWTADSSAEDTGALFFDADEDGDADLYVVSGGAEAEAGSDRYRDRLYLNEGGGRYRPAPEALPTTNASGSCVVSSDFDRDGDLDLFVCGRVRPDTYPRSPESYLLENRSGSPGAASADSPRPVRFVARGPDVLPGLPELGMVTDALWTDFNGDGWPDLIAAGEFMPVRFFRNLGGDEGNTVRFEEVTDETGLPPMHGWWNSLAEGDFDGDGDTDYLAGNLGLNAPYRVGPDEPLCLHVKDYNLDGRLDPVASYYTGGARRLVHPRDRLIDQMPELVGRFPSYESYASARFEEAFRPQEREGAQVLCSERFASSYIENRGDGRFRVRSLPRRAQVAPVYGIGVADYDGDGHLDAALVGNSRSPAPDTGPYEALKGLLLTGGGDGTFEPLSVRASGLFVDGDAKALARIRRPSGRPVIVAARNDGPIETLLGPAER